MKRVLVLFDGWCDAIFDRFDERIGIDWFGMSPSRLALALGALLVSIAVFVCLIILFA